MRHAESDIQQACVSWFRYSYPELSLLFFAVPNGGARSKVEASIMKGEGVQAGVADSLLLVPRLGYHGLCVEFKRESFDYVGMKLKTSRTRQSPAQKEWEKVVTAQGYRYAVVYNVDQFIELIKDYLR